MCHSACILWRRSHLSDRQRDATAVSKTSEVKRSADSSPPRFGGRRQRQQRRAAAAGSRQQRRAAAAGSRQQRQRKRQHQQWQRQRQQGQRQRSGSSSSDRGVGAASISSTLGCHWLHHAPSVTTANRDIDCRYALNRSTPLALYLYTQSVSPSAHVHPLFVFCRMCCTCCAERRRC